MIKANSARYWLSWLAFFGGVVALLSAASFIPMFVLEFGRDYPGKVVTEIPLGTAWFLENMEVVMIVCRVLAVLAVIAIIPIARRSKSRDIVGHSAALLASLLYHVAFMTVLMFLVMFFVLPHAKAAI